MRLEVSIVEKALDLCIWRSTGMIEVGLSDLACPVVWEKFTHLAPTICWTSIYLVYNARLVETILIRSNLYGMTLAKSATFAKIPIILTIPSMGFSYGVMEVATKDLPYLPYSARLGQYRAGHSAGRC
jgi:hypothetical protein